MYDSTDGLVPKRSGESQPPPLPMTETPNRTAPKFNPIKGANLGLVLEVELNALLRFGQRQLSLREVLDLTTGSVIELDRRVDDPVELLLDGKVIAKGEAAIVNGNYGLRVTEIVQPASAVQFPRGSGH